MIDYFQPDFYRFNEDSLKLVNWVVKKNISGNHILDLGAGCGIIGIEASRSLRPLSASFVEVQEDFLPFLNQNLKTFLPAKIEFHIFHMSFSQFYPQKKYDLILSNPPYYLPGRGELSPDSRRAISRSFIQDGWRVLISKIQESLADEGMAFLVLKNELLLKKEILREASLNQLKVNYHEFEGTLIAELSTLNED